jgi:hypothetical protein
MKWKLKELEKQLSIEKTNKENSQSTVGGVTETGPTQEKYDKDPFLDGFYDE